MGRVYYYFGASLPMLHFGHPPPMTVVEFVGQCETLLDKEDFEFIRQLLDLETEELKTDRAEFQLLLSARHNFRNAMAEFRAERAGKDPSEYIRGYRFKSQSISDILQQAAREENLLEGEMTIDRARWNFFDQMQAGHFNDIVFFGFYGLKLMVLERHAQFATTAGSQKLEEYRKLCFPKEEEAISQ